MTTSMLQSAACSALFAYFSLTCFGTANAHGGSAGDVEITHPYATPSVPGARNGVAYIATLQNTGKQPDRLLRVSTPVAGHAEIHTMSMDTGGVMRMREVGNIDLAPGAAVKMRPGDGFHFMLVDLKQPLKEGDSFPMTMEFEHGGKVEVKVVVQVPKARGEAMSDGMAEHKH
jgi:periplasmic copper chaperone A